MEDGKAIGFGEHGKPFHRLQEGVSDPPSGIRVGLGLRRRGWFLQHPLAFVWRQFDWGLKAQASADHFVRDLVKPFDDGVAGYRRVRSRSSGSSCAWGRWASSA